MFALQVSFVHSMAPLNQLTALLVTTASKERWVIGCPVLWGSTNQRLAKQPWRRVLLAPQGVSAPRKV